MAVFGSESKEMKSPAIAPPPAVSNPSKFHKKDLKLRGDDNARVPRLGSMANVYTSPNAALSPATGPSALVQNTLDQIILQSGSVLQKHILSETGRRVTQDIRLLADSSQKAINEKLEGGKLIEDMWDAQRNIHLKHPSSESLALEDSQTTLQNSLQILKLFGTSSEFRKLVADLIQLFSDQISGWADKPTPRNPNASSESLPDHRNDVIDSFSEAEEGQLYEQQPNTINSAPSWANDDSVYESTTIPRTLSNASIASNKPSTEHSTSKKMKNSISQAFPPQARQTLASRFKQLMADVESHPEYRPALDYLISKFQFLTELNKDIEIVDDSHSQDSNRLREDIKIAIQNFCGRNSLDPFLLAIRQLRSASAHDAEVQEFWIEIKEFITASLRDPQFVQSTDYDGSWNNFIARSRALLYDNPAYRGTLLTIADEADALVNAFNIDATTTTLRRSFANLWKDAFLDEKGRPCIKLDLLQDMRRVLPSVFKENLHAVHIPRVEYSEPDMDYFADNIILHAEDILPKYVVLDIRTALDTTYTTLDSSITTYLRLQISEMHLSASNIDFGYKKKTGFPHLRERGMVDFTTKGGKGVQMNLLLQPDFSRSEKAFRLVESECNIAKLSIRLHDTKHGALNKIATPFITRIVKKRVCDAVEAQVRAIMESVGTAAVVAGSAARTKAVGLEARAEQQGIIMPAT